MKVLYVLFLLDTLNLAVYLPIFSAFVRSLGGTPFTLGLINSSTALITLLWNPIAGSLSDQVGRKGLLTKCMIASSIGSLILCASSSSLYLVFIGRLIGALGSPVTILLRSTVADTFKTDEEKKLFLNKSGPLISLAFLVGSLSSGFLSEAKNGYLYAFLLMAIITGSASLVAQTGLTEDPKRDIKDKKKISFAKRTKQELETAVFNIKTISWPRYKELFIMKGLYELSFCTILANVGFVLLNEFNLKGRYIGYVFFMTSVFSIVSNVLKLKLNKRFAKIPDHSKIIQGGLILAISYLGMSISGSVYVFLFFIGIMCFTRTFMDVLWIEMITTKTLEDDRGKVFAVFENMFHFMSFIAPVLSGLIAEAYGQRILLGSASIPICLAVLVAYYRKNKTE